MIEVRWHGRGGQGVVTSSELLARAALKENRHVQHFPEFGPERRGAPVRAYTRISDEPIEIHTGVYEPDIVVVIDPSLVYETKLYLEGVKKGTKIVLNAKEVKKEIADKVKELGAELYYVDAYTIALEIFGKPFYNTPMLGALVKATNLVPLESVESAMRDRFSGEIAEKNIAAARRAFEEVKKYE